MKKLYLLLLITIIVSTSIYAQDKVVSQTIQAATLFSVPGSTDMKRITNHDLARMECKLQMESRETFISKKT